MTEREYIIEGQVKQVIRRLCSLSAEAYLKWKTQLDHVLKKLPCRSPKAKLDMTEAILYGDLLESWKLWYKTESEKNMESIFQKKDTGEIHKKKFQKGEINEEFKYCLDKVRQKFIKKYDARNQRV